MEILGMPVMPLKTGVLQYDWIDAGLRGVARRFRNHPVKIAMANIMRPNLDDGIEWSVIGGIIRKELACTSVKLYVYPPPGVDVPEHGAEPEAVGGATA